MEFTIHEGMMWQPVHTKPRCEKKFLSFCEKYSIEAYLPLKVRLNTVRSKIQKTLVPMFPGYAFACLDTQLKHDVAVTNSVVNFISLNHSQELFLIEDLKGIFLMEQLQTHEENLIVSPEIKPGREILIKSGPLKGLSGIVRKRKGVHRVIVNVELISQSACMELDASDIELGY